jgi:hypothetical protein
MRSARRAFISLPSFVLLQGGVSHPALKDILDTDLVLLGIVCHDLAAVAGAE